MYIKFIPLYGIQPFVLQNNYHSNREFNAEKRNYTKVITFLFYVGKDLRFSAYIFLLENNIYELRSCHDLTKIHGYHVESGF